MRLWIWFFPLIFPISMNAHALCPDARTTKVLSQNANGKSLLWEFTNTSTALTNPFTFQSPLMRQYTNWVRQNTSLTAFQGIANSIRVRQQALQRISSPNDSFRVQLEVDIRNLQRVMTGKIGRIRSVQCLEGLPFEEFLKVANLTRQPQEFAVLILRKNGQRKLLGDFYRQKNSGVIGVSSSKAVRNEFQNLRQQGWTYEAHLHNHPYDFKNPYGDIGGNLVPSDADVLLYQYDQPEKALITDGLQVIEIPRRDFGKFEVLR